MLFELIHTTDEEQLENEPFSISASHNNMLECLGSLFKCEAFFLNTAKENTICGHFHRLFNNDLDFTISALIGHGSKNKILYTEPVFLPLLSIMTNICLKNSVIIPIHVF